MVIPPFSRHLPVSRLATQLLHDKVSLKARLVSPRFRTVASRSVEMYENLVRPMGRAEHEWNWSSKPTPRRVSARYEPCRAFLGRVRSGFSTLPNTFSHFRTSAFRAESG